MTAMLNVHDLRAYYGQVQALHGLSFSLNEGSLTTLLGANGAGKTTTLKAVTGTLPYAGGDVRYEGRSIAGTGAHALVGRGLAMVPEASWPWMTTGRWAGNVPLIRLRSE